MLKYLLAIAALLLVTIVPSYSHDTRAIQDGHETHSPPDDNICSIIQRYNLSDLNEAEREAFISDNVNGPHVWSGNTLIYVDRFITEIDLECPDLHGMHYHYYTMATDGAGDREGDRWIGTPDDNTVYVKPSIIVVPIVTDTAIVNIIPIPTPTIVYPKICPVGWEKGSEEAIIVMIRYKWLSEGRGPYKITSLSIYTKDPELDMEGWKIEIDQYYGNGRLRITEDIESKNVDLDFRTNSVDNDLLGFSILLIDKNKKVVDRADSCYVISASRDVFRKKGEIERVIPQGLHRDAGIVALNDDWNDYYRSAWAVRELVGSAPSLYIRKPTVMWANLKRGE